MRNSLKCVLCASLMALTLLAVRTADAQTKSQWTTLFDGTSTDAWRGYKMKSFPGPDSWIVDQGALKSVPRRPVDLITKEKYDNFELELEFKVDVGANSGIMYRVSEDTDETYKTGPEMQIVDDDHSYDGKDPLTSAGSLYALVAPKNKKLNPAGQWNRARLIVVGQHVEHWLNGEKIVEYELGSPSLKALIAKAKYKDWPKYAKNKTGFIALQDHGTDLPEQPGVWFRNIRIRKLPPPGQVTR